MTNNRTTFNIQYSDTHHYDIQNNEALHSNALYNDATYEYGSIPSITILSYRQSRALNIMTHH
jgi:hypothetical protein